MAFICDGKEALSVEWTTFFIGVCETGNCKRKKLQLRTPSQKVEKLQFWTPETLILRT